MITQEATVPKLEIPFTCIIAGAIGSGKKSHSYSRFFRMENRCLVPNRNLQFIYCYYIYQKLYGDVKTSLLHNGFYEGILSKDDLEAWGAELGMKVLVLAERLQKAAKNPNIVDLFCQYSHHLHFSTCFVIQNLFAERIRSLSLYTHYFILLKNHRDQTLGR